MALPDITEACGHIKRLIWKANEHGITIGTTFGFDVVHCGTCFRTVETDAFKSESQDRAKLEELKRAPLT
jgi:hypothetical protein